MSVFARGMFVLMRRQIAYLGYSSCCISLERGSRAEKTLRAAPVPVSEACVDQTFVAAMEMHNRENNASLDKS